MITVESQFFILLMFVIWVYISAMAYQHNDTILLYVQFLAQIPLVLYLFTLAFFDGIVLGYGVMVSLLCASIYLVFLGTAFSFEYKKKNK